MHKRQDGDREAAPLEVIAADLLGLAAVAHLAFGAGLAGAGDVPEGLGEAVTDLARLAADTSAAVDMFMRAPLAGWPAQRARLASIASGLEHAARRLWAERQAGALAPLGELAVAFIGLQATLRASGLLAEIARVDAACAADPLCRSIVAAGGGPSVN